MPTDHHAADRQAADDERRQAIADRQALNVRYESERLLSALLSETDSLIKMGEPYFAQARENHALCMRITSGLCGDDIRALAAILHNTGR